jgi:DNA-binding transcriptional regulator YdaS (Cro superfamily)
MNRETIVEEVIELAGGGAALARHLGITRPALAYWRRIPAKHVLNVERAINKKRTRHQMRPDIYPLEQNS